MNRTPAVVLVVEDHEPTRELLSEVLGAEGYAVETVRDGGHGLARLEAGGIDAILLDRRLPDMDGRSLCRQLRARGALTTVPIILMSAEADEAERTAAFADGASDYLTKPFELDELLAVVTHHCTNA
jgi:two-component system, OmpR family, response regulator